MYSKSNSIVFAVFAVLAMYCEMGFGLGTARVPNVREACPNVTTMPDFDATRYVGRWYEKANKNFYLFQYSSSCIFAEYGINDDGTLSVYNNGLLDSGDITEICGYAECGPAHPAECVVYFPDVLGVGTYWVLDTDYDHWSAVYSCNSILDIKFEFAWILSRTPQLPANFTEMAYNAFTSQGVDVSDFIDTEQPDSCTYDKPVPSCSDP